MKEGGSRSIKDPEERRRKMQSRLIWATIIIVLLIPIPREDGVWYLNGLLFRFFDFINAKFLPENF